MDEYIKIRVLDKSEYNKFEKYMKNDGSFYILYNKGTHYLPYTTVLVYIPIG